MNEEQLRADFAGEYPDHAEMLSRVDWNAERLLAPEHASTDMIDGYFAAEAWMTWQACHAKYADPWNTNMDDAPRDGVGLRGWICRRIRGEPYFSETYVWWSNSHGWCALNGLQINGTVEAWRPASKGPQG